MDKIRLKGVLNDRAFFLRSMDELFQDLVDLTEDMIKTNNLPKTNPNRKRKADPFDMPLPFDLTDEEKLDAAIFNLYLKGRELLENEEYEKMEYLTHDYKKLIEIYEKKYGPYTPRQGGSTGPTNGEDGPSGLF